MSDSFIRLDGQRSTYVIDVSGKGMPLCRYWGRLLPENTDLDVLPVLLERPLPQAGLDQDVALALLPEFGFGWFGVAGLTGCRDRRDWATVFALSGVEKTQEGVVLLHCQDTVAGLELTLEISMDAETDVLTRRTRLRNAGSDDYRLDWCAAGAFAVPARCVEVLNFEGQWAQEFQERRLQPGLGNWSRENRRGRTSHDTFPQVIVGTGGFSEEAGEVYGFHLGWSGNHRVEVEGLNESTRQVELGEWLAPGEVVLAPGESYQSPPVYAAYAATGLNKLSDSFHRFVRRRILKWPGGRMGQRPVHINTWEALYFDHDLDSLKELARNGAELGVERFVLDDGWFKGRDHDRAALGDWIPDPKKYPQGLGPLVDYVTGLGMEFGLWIEPEMINPDSDLYRNHPDWALHLKDRPMVLGRHQLVLDLSREEVSDYLFDTINKLLTDHPIGYLKWDMNRDLATPGSSRNQGAAVYRRQTLALYGLLDRFRKAHPQVEIESCASGAGRADYGILNYTHRIWTSDNNDALERQTIQQGFLRFYPPELMGAHIGPSPAHIGYRRHTLAFRASIALFGHLGLELDVRTLDDQERSEIKAWIETYKRFRELLHGGRTHLLSARREAGRGGHGVVAPDKGEALFAIVQTMTSRLRISPPVRLPGLDSDAVYRLHLAGPPPPHVKFKTQGLCALEAGTLKVPGVILANVGLQIPILPPETVLLIHLQRCSQ